MSGEDRPSELTDAGFSRSIAVDTVAIEDQISAELVEVLPAGWVVRFDPAPH